MSKNLLEIICFFSNPSNVKFEFEMVVQILGKVDSKENSRVKPLLFQFWAIHQITNESNFYLPHLQKVMTK